MWIYQNISTKRIINKKEDWIVRENTHEAIISNEDFELVQQLIKSRKRIRSKQWKHALKAKTDIN
ncbi:recombinase family protein [Peribacillus sp. NPDC046944]|uniref:recombinase family protein n=1 Tax=unclassified Peribacillus TaxID=2675266 RepID=UPI003CFC17A8